MNFYDFGIDLNEFEMKICKKVIFGSFWKKFIFGNFDLRGVFSELQKIHAFSEGVVDFQSFKMSSRSPKNDFVWPSKRSEQIVVQKSYFY